jgi:hypothetical protein
VDIQEREDEKLDSFEAALEKPEEELRAPKSLSRAGLACLVQIIDMARDNRMLTEQDHNRALAILQTNPHIRLSKVSRRLRVIEDTIGSIKAVDSRLERIVLHTQEELEIVRKLTAVDTTLGETPDA